MRPHRVAGLFAANVAGLAGAAHASLIVTAPGTEVVVGFDGFDGSGFDDAPLSGQLDSSTWRVTGLSDGPGTFGGTHVSGDFARGTSGGGVSSGGVYAFEVAPGDVALGVQATGTDFSPGEITLRLRNETGQALSGLDIQYDVYVFNDQDRSSSFDLGWSIDDLEYVEVLSAGYVSPEVADAEPAWQADARAWMLTDVTLEDGEEIYLRWRSDDVGGAGSRDELALDNLRITAVPAPSTLALLGAAAMTLRRRRRGWEDRA